MDQQREAESKHDPNAWWFGQIGLCGVYPRPSDTTEIAQDREQCMAFNNQYNPSIGTDGRFCQCWKPHVDHGTMSVEADELAAHQREFEENVMERDVEDGDGGEAVGVEEGESVHRLFQSDFVSGTYRIDEPGTYILMEDIVFDFNAGDVESPNSGDGWWPREEQEAEYPGAYRKRDEYFMGFFAGITVEADDVTLDLNGFSVAMSVPFYYQQRFFSCIALKSVAFPLNQGPGNFGMTPKYANNVHIKNGDIGLSSHHGIHGHFNHNVTITDVHVYGFETHGIQMSYFKDLTIENVEIGPSSTVAYLKGLKLTTP